MFDVDELRTVPYGAPMGYPKCVTLFKDIDVIVGFDMLKQTILMYDDYISCSRLRNRVFAIARNQTEIMSRTKKNHHLIVCKHKIIILG